MQLLFDHIFGNKQIILNLDLNRYMFNPLKGLNCMFVTVVNTRHPYWRGSNIIYIYILLYTYVYIYIYSLYIHYLEGWGFVFSHGSSRTAAYLATQIEKPAHLDLDVGSWWECWDSPMERIYIYIYIVYIWKTTILLMGKSTINGLYIYIWANYG